MGVGLTIVDVGGRYSYYALSGVESGHTFMPGFSINTDVDVDVNDPMTGVYNDTYSMDVKGSLKRTSGQLLVNVYPSPHASSFFVAAGAYFGGSSLVKIEGHSDKLKDLIAQGESAGIVIGDYTIPVDNNGNVSGGLKVSGFRPYLGLDSVVRFLETGWRDV